MLFLETSACSKHLLTAVEKHPFLLKWISKHTQNYVTK